MLLILNININKIIMNIIEPDSTFSAYVNFTLSQTDDEVLNLLYFPIIGKDAFAIYNLLSSFSSLKGNDYFISHEDFCKKNNISISEFLLARNKLEAIKLIETYRKEIISTSSYKKVMYIYKLCPPATANKFFNDPILFSLLNSSISNKDIISLKTHFKEGENKFFDYINVSSKIDDVFFIDKSNLKINKDLTFKEKKYKKIFSVDLAKIEKALLSYNFDISKITKYEKTIEKYLALYQIKEELAVDIISSCISTSGEFSKDIFIDKCKNAYSYTHDKSSSISNLNKYNSNEDITKYQTKSTKEFITELFNAEPTVAILNKINDIVERYNFSSDIINAIFDYCLKSNDGLYNGYKIDELCMYLSYNKVNDLFSAIQFLNRKDYKINEIKEAKERRKRKITEEDNTQVSKKEKIDKDEYLKKLGIDL